MPGANAAGFRSWIDERRKVEPLTADKDVFGDGSVVVLRTPGHTPGHSALLVRLKDKGPVLLTGDLVHFRENYESGGVPSFNFDRAQTVASIERVKKIEANLKATVIIQHDMRDIDKLPAFPAAAKDARGAGRMRRARRLPHRPRSRARVWRATEQATQQVVDAAGFRARSPTPRSTAC